MTGVARAGRPVDALWWLPVILGCAALLVRPVGGVATPQRLAVLAAIAVAVAVCGLAFPAGIGRTDRAGAVVALAAGGAALACAWLVGGPRISPRADGAAVAVSVAAAVAEELLFRRALFGALLRAGPAVALVGSAVVFAAVHVPAYGWAALPVDLGAGLLFGWQRQASGTWAVPALTHAAANVIGGLW